MQQGQVRGYMRPADAGFLIRSLRSAAVFGPFHVSS